MLERLLEFCRHAQNALLVLTVVMLVFVAGMAFGAWGMTERTDPPIVFQVHIPEPEMEWPEDAIVRSVWTECTCGALQGDTVEVRP